MLDIVGSPPGSNGQNRLQDDSQRDRRFAGAAATRLKTPFHFNELRHDVNGKISPPIRLQ
jgi:hypothetical protein